MDYRIDRNYNWDDKPGKIKIAGRKYSACVDSEWTPDKSQRIGNIKSSGKGKKNTQNYLLATGKHIPISSYDGKNHLFSKKKGWIHVISDDESSDGFVKVTGVRVTAIIAMILLLAGAALVIVSLFTGVAPQSVPSFFADQVGITNNNAEQKSSISYATYQSTGDTTWIARQTNQQISLVLPATVSLTDENGETEIVANPVVAAPSIWVDLNNDGIYESDECLFNPPTYDDNGNLLDAGDLLQPGNQIDQITLSQPIAAGTYNAQTLWTPQMADSGAPANPMTFTWTLTVQ